jgi:peptidyl-prolyl cis-trans isomerase C
LSSSNRSEKTLALVFFLALTFLLASGICFSEGTKRAVEPAEEEAVSPSGKTRETSPAPERKRQLVDVNAAARVNGVIISRVELDKSYNAYIQQRGMDTQMLTNPQRYEMVQREVLDQLIGRELLWQEAQKKNLIVPDEEVERALSRALNSFPSEDEFKLRLAQIGYTEHDYREVLRRELSVRDLIQKDIARGVSVSDDEIHEYYQVNPDQFKRPEQIHARHILVKLEPEADEAARQEAKRKIETILKKAKGGADFAELAKKHSEGPSAPKGGDLGFFSRGQMVKPFEEAAFSLKTGEVSGVVQTIYGYHIIKVEEKKEPQTVAEEDVREQIRQFLYSKKLQNAVHQRVNNLRQQAKVEILLP